MALPASSHTTFQWYSEAMIKATKKAIYAILGAVDITDEKLLSAVVDADGLINFRPLTYQTDDSNRFNTAHPQSFSTLSAARTVCAGQR